jgi:sugar phosphate isomerase/epimerase
VKLAASNIAWSYDERLRAYAILRDHGFAGIEIAPGILFADEPNPFVPSEQALHARRLEFDRFGLEPVSIQSLLYGVDDAALFGSQNGRKRLEERLAQAVELAGRLGAGNLVFGSPRQRNIPTNLERNDVIAIVRDVFRPLGDRAATHGVYIALEPNAAAYGTNFMTTFSETLEIVRTVNHPAVTLNFDLGALYMTDSFDRLAFFAKEAAIYISHVHVSSANLDPAPRTQEDACTLFKALKSIGYDRAISLELKTSANALMMLDRAAALLEAAARKEFS